MENKIYGYIRVSSQEQNEDHQLIAMAEIGVPWENIYIDKQSGKDFDRPNYKRLVKKLREGDIMFISDIVLQLLSFVAENERVNIKQRQAEGIAAAKKRGVKFGRPIKEMPPNFAEIIEKWEKKRCRSVRAKRRMG